MVSQLTFAFRSLVVACSLTGLISSDHDLLAEPRRLVRPGVLLIVLETSPAETTSLPIVARIQQEGMLFEQYVQTTPDADAAQLSLLTGRYPSSIRTAAGNLQQDISIDSLATTLTRKDYQCEFIGVSASSNRSQPGATANTDPIRETDVGTAAADDLTLQGFQVLPPLPQSMDSESRSNNLAQWSSESISEAASQRLRYLATTASPFLLVVAYPPQHGTAT
ncbi:MAG: sulfatase-like hydrolase/transferase, partial [Planctomycetaceae bacterium]|nr:sulfatase-like hydrolase/transferase [Planctomycetaceae bacterium]